MHRHAHYRCVSRVGTCALWLPSMDLINEDGRHRHEKITMELDGNPAKAHEGFGQYGRNFSLRSCPTTANDCSPSNLPTMKLSCAQRHQFISDCICDIRMQIMGLHLYLLRYLGIRRLIANMPLQLLPISCQAHILCKERCSLSAL